MSYHTFAIARSLPIRRCHGALARSGVLAALVLTSCGLMPGVADAQIPAPPTTVVISKDASLSDFLINRLRATTDDQRDYVRKVVKLVEDGKLEKRLVLALERYARRKSPYFPLPIYERALRFEAGKRGVAVPTIEEIVARNGASAAQAIRDSRFR